MLILKWCWEHLIWTAIIIVMVYGLIAYFCNVSVEMFQFGGMIMVISLYILRQYKKHLDKQQQSKEGS